LIYIRDVSLELELHKKYLIEKDKNQEILVYSEFDSLTHFHNQRLFMWKYESLCQAAKKRKFQFAIIVFQFDDLEAKIKEYGLSNINKAIQSIAKSIRNECIRYGDYTGRLKDNSFGLILFRCGLPAAKKVAKRILNLSHTVFQVVDEKFKLTISAGIAEFGNQNLKGDKVLELSTLACENAAKKGNCVVSGQK